MDELVVCHQIMEIEDLVVEEEMGIGVEQAVEVILVAVEEVMMDILAEVEVLIIMELTHLTKLE